MTLINLDPIQYQKEMAEIVLTAAVEGASLLSETVTDVIAPAVVEAAGACADRIRGKSNGCQS